MFVAWLSIAHALDLKGHSLGTVHGWTADGALVLEVIAHDLYEPPVINDASDLEPGTLRYAVVLQGDREVHRWLIGKELPPFAKVETPLQTGDWTSWRNSHPLAPASHSRAASNGVRFEVRTEGNAPEAKGEGFSVLGHRDDETSTFATTGLSNAGEGFWTVHRHEIELPPWQGALYTSLDAYWAADGRRVAVLVEKPESATMRGPVFGKLSVFLVRSAPLVGVLAPAGTPASVTDKVVAAIGGLGLVQKGEAKAARDASVVYFAPGYEADAKAIAAAVPGGATTAPMDWKAAQHVVVAVGSSAR